MGRREAGDGLHAGREAVTEEVTYTVTIARHADGGRASFEWGPAADLALLLEAMTIEVARSGWSMPPTADELIAWALARRTAQAGV